MPLIEIVTEPDLRGPEEAHAYLTALRAVLLYVGVSDGNMEEGSLRCDANVSVRPRGAAVLGTRAEIKNLNSFRHVARAIEHEITRQVALVESGREVVQETRLWNAERGETRADALQGRRARLPLLPRARPARRSRSLPNGSPRCSSSLPELPASETQPLRL